MTGHLRPYPARLLAATVSLAQLHERHDDRGSYRVVLAWLYAHRTARVVHGETVFTEQDVLDAEAGL